MSVAYYYLSSEGIHMGEYIPFHEDPWDEEQDQEVEDKKTNPMEFLQAFGIERTSLTPLIEARLRLLSSETKVFEDECRAADHAKSLFAYWESIDSPLRLSKSQQQDVIVGTLFSDIGKTGPANATHEQSEVITAMYGIDEPVVLEETTVHAFLKRFFSEPQKEMEEIFSGMGLDPDMLMSEFFRLHVFWSIQIIQNSDLPLNGKIAAMSHHIMEGYVPEGIHSVGSVDLLDVHRDLDQRELVVLLLDKYDARRRRGRVDHDQAIAYLRELPEKQQAFQKFKKPVQALYHQCVDDLDHALRVRMDIMRGTEAA